MELQKIIADKLKGTPEDIARRKRLLEGALDSAHGDFERIEETLLAEMEKRERVFESKFEALKKQL